MITERKLANALSGKTARACDSCLRKRARWFCTGDDAFLCQSCDESVHSANQVASRHERIRLETASSKTSGSIDSPPAWHQGFTRKARTPRPNNNNNKKTIYKHNTNEEKVLNSKNNNNSPPPLLPLVPENGSEKDGCTIFADEDEDEDQLLYRVPVFDPFAAELCTDEIAMGNEENMFFDACCGREQQGSCELDNLSVGFLPSDKDLAEFAADVENLLATGLDDDSPDIKDLGLLEFCNNNNSKDQEHDDHKVVMKVKDEQEMDAIAFDHMARESLMDWSFNNESQVTGDEEVEEKVVPVGDKGVLISCSEEHNMKRNVSLRLNYEEVITAWASHGSPWTTGSRPPDLNPDDCWPDCMGTCPKEGHHRHIYGGHTGSGNGGREARVLRYKEKRRTRLFSKKIRYEVRRLNAEKRPRMKGRFVKRTSFMGSTAFPCINK